MAYTFTKRIRETLAYEESIVGHRRNGVTRETNATMTRSLTVDDDDVTDFYGPP